MNKPESTRQQRVAGQIQKDISDIFLKEGASLVNGSMVSVTKVRMSPDLALAKVYLSVFPFANASGVVAKVKKNAATLRYELGRRVGKQLRIIPELSFYVDDSLEYVENLEKLIKQ